VRRKRYDSVPVSIGIFTVSTGVWKAAKKKYCEGLDIFGGYSKITNGSAHAISVEHVQGIHGRV